MIISDIHPLISMLLIIAPAAIHHNMMYRKWKKSDLDLGIPRTQAMFQVNQPGMWSALPISKYKKYWSIQIGIPAFLLFPFEYVWSLFT